MTEKLHWEIKILSWTTDLHDANLELENGIKVT